MRTELEKFYGSSRRSGGDDDDAPSRWPSRIPCHGEPEAAGGADLWFVTAEGGGKLRDLEYDPHVNLAYYKPGSYEWVSASGIASVSRDRDKIRELYEPDWKAWFGQEGDPRHGTPDDPRIVLIGVDVHAALFLEVNKPKPVVLFELAKGWLTGERVEAGETHELRAPHR